MLMDHPAIFLRHRALQLVLLAFLVAVLSVHAYSERVWTQASSGKTVTATLRGFDGETVTLVRDKDGKVFNIDVSALGLDDQDYLYRQFPQYDPNAVPVAEPPSGRQTAPTPSRSTRVAGTGTAEPADSGGTAVSGGLPGLLQGLSWNPTLAIILVAANIPLFIFLWGKFFFGDFQGFMTSFSYVLKPDWISFWQGEGMTDMWESWKFNIFFLWCAVTVVAQYVLIQRVF